jgi:hypothetical protein
MLVANWGKANTGAVIANIAAQAIKANLAALMRRVRTPRQSYIILDPHDHFGRASHRDIVVPMHSYINLART